MEKHIKLMYFAIRRLADLAGLLLLLAALWFAWR